jgi:hypothetical protein
VAAARQARQCSCGWASVGWKANGPDDDRARGLRRERCFDHHLTRARSAATLPAAGPPRLMQLNRDWEGGAAPRASAAAGESCAPPGARPWFWRPASHRSDWDGWRGSFSRSPSCYPRSGSGRCDDSPQSAKVACVRPGWAGLRGARAAILLLRSPMPAGSGCAPTRATWLARSLPRAGGGIRAIPASLMNDAVQACPS